MAYSRDLLDDGMMVQHKIAHYFSEVLGYNTIEYPEKSLIDMLMKTDITVTYNGKIFNIDVKSNSRKYNNTITLTTVNGNGESIQYFINNKNFMLVFVDYDNKNTTFYWIPNTKMQKFIDIVNKKPQMQSSHHEKSRYVILNKFDLREFKSKSIDWDIWNNLSNEPL